MLNVRSCLRSLLLCAALALGAWSCSSDEPSGGRRNGGASGAGAGNFNPVGGNGATSGSAGTGIGGSAGLAGASGVGVSGSGGNSGMCAEASVYVSRNTPQIMFVIDGSGSMCADFGGSTRWQSLRGALLAADTGLIPRLQATAEFGLLVYDGTIDGLLAITAVGTPSPPCAGMYLEQKAMGECPGLVPVPVALNNAPAIDMAYPMTELGGSTPTDKAMNRAIDDLIAIRPTNPDVMAKPQYVILATDGAPNDICIGGVGGDGAAQKQGVIAAVDRGAAMQIRTFVVSLAGGDASLQMHLDEVARHGDPMNPMARTYTPESPEELVTQLAALVGGADGCDITLNGTVQEGRECTGEVTMNGIELPCCEGGVCAGTPPSGWRLKDASTIELMGSTCLDFLTAQSATLKAGFPCGVFVVE